MIQIATPNDFVNSMISHSFLPNNLQPSQVTDHSATIIDNTFSNITDFEILSGNITALVADHFAQFLLFKKCYIQTLQIFCISDYSNFAKEKFIHDFSLLDWSFFHNFELSTSDKFDNFYIKSVACIDSHIFKKKSHRNLKLRTKPWINGAIQKLMSYRDKLFIKMNNNPTESNKSLYQKFRNHAVSEQCKEKSNYFLKYFEKNKTNMKKLWTGIKSIVNVKAKNQLSQISHLTDNGVHITDPVKMAHVFNQYFVIVGSNVDKPITRTRKSPLDFFKLNVPRTCNSPRIGNYYSFHE